MAITIGQQLGSYRITALLGKGGMGEVYRARDSKLKRDVAIKILPDEFSRDADRVARFQREAEVLAALNHPNIGAIYDLQHENQTRFLVLELVEGETLAQRIARGPIPVEESLDIGKHICEALEAAHERAIIHRDLKPANVKITLDCKVKVLDFGLAKAMESSPTNATLSNSPTMLSATIGGMIVGTAAYMSPEQARGREADQRSDVFAFGCVLFEMLTGKQAFQGEDVADVLASVMKIDADLNLLPANLNPRLYELLRRCLAKNRKERWHAIGDVRFELETIASAPRVVPELVSINASKPRSLRQHAIPVVVTAIIVAIIAGLAGWKPKPSVAALVTRFQLAPPDLQNGSPRGVGRAIAISPDGTKLIYTGVNGQLFLRRMSEIEARAIGPDGATNPFFSPDGQWVGFFSPFERTLKKIPITGGTPIRIGTFETNAIGPSWEDNQIVFGLAGKGIMRVSPEGGEPETLAALTSEEGFAYAPQILDAGKAVLFSLAPTGVADSSLDTATRIVIQSLSSGERKVVIRGGTDAHYVSSGHIVYVLAGDVLAAPFDLKRLEVTGPSITVIDGVMRAQGGGTGGLASFAFSNNGALAYIAGDRSGTSLPRATLALADRNGKIQALPLSPASYEYPRISPDGKQLAVGTNDGREQVVSIYDLSGGTTLRRLTFGGNNSIPIWSHDGRYVFFRSNRDGRIGLFRQLADGTGSAERLTTAESLDFRHFPSSVHPSGKELLFDVRRGTDNDVWILPLDGDRKPKPLLAQPQSQFNAVFSPDGRWLAYASNESEFTGRPEIFVQPYPLTGAKYKITTGGGGDPLWSPDGKELFYSWDSKLFTVDVRMQPAFSSGKPYPLQIDGIIQRGGFPRNYDITPDGKQFLVVLPAPQAGTSQQQPLQINVVLNWLEELKQRLPVK